MEAQVYLWTNQDEIERNETMGLPKPEPQEKLFTMHFRLDDVTLMYRHSESRMICYIFGTAFPLKYNAGLFKEIAEYLNS